MGDCTSLAQFPRAEPPEEHASLLSSPNPCESHLDALRDEFQLADPESRPSDWGHASVVPHSISEDATIIEKEDVHAGSNCTTDTDPRNEIVALFKDLGLPELVAHTLVDPEG